MQLRQIPHPYRAMLAICSDLDETPDRHVYWEIMRFLNTTEITTMAAGVPLVTSNRCGMPYMVRDGESGFLVDPNDPDDIARRLERLLKNDELRQSMGARGREIALDRFHPAKVPARAREVYLRAVQDFPRKQTVTQ